MYVHGGGFACTSFFQYKQSLTFLCRAAGYVVIGVDYPQSTQASFPAPQMALLRALRDACVLFPGMCTVGVHLFGDSAGGNLALQVAALLVNP